jgi:hypothetical protein
MQSTASTLLNSLNGYWKLEEASGTRADSSGLGNNLTAVNAPTNAAGKQGNALSCASASTQYLNVASNSTLQTGDIDFTVACWVNMATLTTYRAFMSKSDGTVAGSEYLLYYEQPALRIQCTFYHSAGSSLSVVGNALGAPSASTWYFLVAWHDSVANTVNLQINNGTVDSTAHSLGVNANASGFSIGAQGAGGLPMDGLIDEAGFWKRVLTAAERTTLYNAGAGKTYPF